MPEQFDVVIHLDEPPAVELIEQAVEWDKGEVPETFPVGVWTHAKFRQAAEQWSSRLLGKSFHVRMLRHGPTGRTTDDEHAFLSSNSR